MEAIHRNIGAFLEHRGYSVVADAGVPSKQSSADVKVFKGTRGNKEIAVYLVFAGGKYVKNIKDFKKFAMSLGASGTREVLVVLGPDIPEKIRGKCMLASPGIFGEFGRVVSHKIFSANLPRMAIVPEHTVLTAEEAQELCIHYCIDGKKIDSVIFWQTDAACIWCGAARGDIVKITRRSDVGESVDYRICK